MKKHIKRWVVLVIVATLFYYFISPKTYYYVYKEGKQIMKVDGKVVPLPEEYRQYQTEGWEDTFQEQIGTKSEQPIPPRIIVDIYYNQGYTVKELYDMEEIEPHTFPDSLNNKFIDDIEIEYTVDYAETKSVDVIWFYNWKNF
jgi:hypothetical protein